VDFTDFMQGYGFFPDKSGFELLKKQLDLRLDEVRFTNEFIEFRFAILLFYSSIVNLKLQS